MLAATKGHEDAVLILTQKGANLDLVDRVSVYIHATSPIKVKKKQKFFSLKKVDNYDSFVIIVTMLKLNYYI